MCVSR